MTEHFLLTFRQLFTLRHLFIDQVRPTFYAGIRYCIISVDVEFLEAKGSAIKRRHQHKVEDVK